MKRLAYILFCLVVLGVTNAFGTQVGDLDHLWQAEGEPISGSPDLRGAVLTFPTQGLPGNIEETQSISLQPTVRFSVKKMAQTVFGREANVGRTNQIIEHIAEARHVHFRLEKYRIDSPFSEFW